MCELKGSKDMLNLCRAARERNAQIQAIACDYSSESAGRDLRTNKDICNVELCDLGTKTFADNLI